MSMPVFVDVPQVGGGYPLKGEWYVVTPVARINEVLNPSFETGTTGYTAGAGSLARSTAKQFHGAYSGAYTPSAALTDGFFYGTISTTLGQFRAISCKFLGQANVPYAFTFASTAAVDLVKYEFRATGRWQWIYIYYLETATTTRRIYFRKNSSSDTHVFYVDGVQSEVINTGEFVSTYIDGDQLGFLANQNPYPYGWNGTPHASTSFRLGTTRAGGHVIPFKRFGFILMAMIGLGMPQVKNVSTEYAGIDGGYPSYTRKPISQFTVAGNLSGPTAQILRYNRGQLGRLFDRDTGIVDQQLLLRYHHTDTCDMPQSDVVSIPCKYVSGFEGQYDNAAAQTLPITFETYMPAVTTEADVGTSLTVQQSVTNANYILKRAANGQWSALSTGAVGSRVYTLFVARSGRVYIGGNFTSLGGVANTQGIGYWDPSDSAFHAMGTGIATLGQEVFCFAEAADGSIYAGGGYSAMGGVANTPNIAKYNPATNAWSALSTGANGSVIGLAISSTGILYLGGAFTTLGGAAIVRAGKWSGSAFSAMSSLNSPANVVTAGPDGKIYYGGSFTSPFNHVIAWNPTTSAFEALATGPGGEANTLKFLPNGVLYAGGVVGMGFLKSWNGNTWSTVVSGLGGTAIDALQPLPDGSLFASGVFTVTSLPNLNDSFVRIFPGVLGGSVIIPTGIDLPGSATSYALAVATNGDIYVGYDQSGTATAEGITAVTNPGSAWGYPTIVISGPSSGTANIDHITNYTTGKTISFNLTIQAGETDTLVLSPDSISFTSDLQGNIASAILPGSSETEFYLVPGSNSIGLFSTSSSVVVRMYWKTAFLSLDDLT